MKTAFLKELQHGLVHMFYPRLCEGCSKPLITPEKVLCISCALQLPETGYQNIPGNETELRFAGRIPFVHATSYAWFTTDGLLQHLIHGLKYKNKKEIGYYLGQRFGHSMQQVNFISTPDLIIPVPLHPAKMAQRGYNQSMYIAQGLSSVLNIPAADDILLRVKNTQTQTNKTRAERVDNMVDAFKIAANINLKDKHILILDDVLTTGATLEACALALMKQESIKISIATVGIAVS